MATALESGYGALTIELLMMEGVVGQSFCSRVDSIVSERRRTVLEGKRESNVKFITVGDERRKVSQEEKEAASKVPLDILAKEWLNQQEVGLEVRCYLVEKLLPTLVMGLEKLLNEVSSRDLVESWGQEPDFNPINFVAQYLMRNNPHYSSFAEAHPYCKAMRLVSEELKKEAYSSLEDKRLSELRGKSKHRCLVREEEEAERVAEVNRRMEMVKDIYGKWLFHGEQSIRVVDVSAGKSLRDLITVSIHNLIGEVCSAVLGRKPRRGGSSG